MIIICEYCILPFVTHQRAKTVIYSKEMAGIPNFWLLFVTKVSKSHVKLHVKPDAMCEM